MDLIIKNYIEDLTALFYRTQADDFKEERFNLNNGLKTAVEMIATANANGRKVIFIGNGGSSTIASHKALDYWLANKIRSVAFSDSAYLTCFSNDFGYQNVFVKQIEAVAETGDVLIAISSSGNSENIILAVKWAREHNCPVITFSGFEETNRLHNLGDLNFYVPLAHCAEHGLDKLAYDKIETVHLMLCNCILELIIRQQRQKIEIEKEKNDKLALSSEKNILVAFDRDGTLIYDTGYFGKQDNWKNEIRFYNGVPEAIKMLNSFADVVVATNQIGVAYGFYGIERVNEIHDYLNSYLLNKGALINNWYFSPYVEKDWAVKNGLDINNPWAVDGFPSTRKPAIGMLKLAAQDLGRELDSYRKVFVVGDRMEDLQMALNAGGIGIWFYNSKNGHLWGEVNKLEAENRGRIFYVSDLIKAAELIKVKSFS